MRILFYIIEIFAGAVHARSNLLFGSIKRSLSRFEFTFKTSYPTIMRNWNTTKKSFRIDLIFWACTAVAIVLISALAIRNPMEVEYDNSLQGYYIQTYNMDLQTMFGQAPRFVAVTPDGQSQQLFGVDDNTPIEDTEGNLLSADELEPGSQVLVRWNGTPNAPDGMVIEVLDIPDFAGLG